MYHYITFAATEAIPLTHKAPWRILPWRIPMWISYTALILFGLFMFLFSIRNVKHKWIIY